VTRRASRARRAAVGAAPLVALLSTVPVAAGAQGPLRGATRPSARVAPAVRADVFAGSATAAHGAVGVAASLGAYLRLDAYVGAGPERADGDVRATAHGEVVARFVLDPFRRSGRGVYAGGGLAWWSRDPRAALGAVVGVEGRARGGWAPAVELGLGRGARLGVALRRGRGR
jgi:hypothetical protein